MYVYVLFIYMIEVSTWHSEAVPRLFGSELGSELGRSELGRSELGRSELGRSELGTKQCHTKLEIGSI